MTRDGDKSGRGGFASRWSQRKRAARSGAAPEESQSVPETAPERVEDDRPDAEILVELGLPDPDTLAPGDDFAAFMAEAVPARLRHRALRRLWLSDPVYANLDMLVEYGEDFTDAATVIPDLKTLYQVGKGFVDRTAPDEEATALPAAPAAGEPAPADAHDPVPAEPATAQDATAPEPDRPAEPETRQPAPAIAPRRRMRFRLAED